MSFVMVSEGLDSRLFPLVFAMACFSLDEAEEIEWIEFLRSLSICRTILSPKILTLVYL
jgi:hypothetical protein